MGGFSRLLPLSLTWPDIFISITVITKSPKHASAHLSCLKHAICSKSTSLISYVRPALLYATAMPRDPRLTTSLSHKQPAPDPHKHPFYSYLPSILTSTVILVGSEVVGSVDEVTNIPSFSTKAIIGYRKVPMLRQNVDLICYMSFTSAMSEHSAVNNL